MMGFGTESLEALNKTQSYKLTNNDLSSVYFHKGESYLMLGEIDNAASHYRKSIKLTPCKTDRYYSYVQACRELKTMRKEMWIDLMNEIRSVMKNCLSAVENGEELNIDFSVYDAYHKHDVSTTKVTAKTATTDESDVYGDDDDDDDEVEEDYTLQSYLQLGDAEETTVSSIENSAVYWALYIVAEKAERYSLAWWYLEKANSIEKGRRELKYHREDTLAQLNQITTVFQKGFWDTLPDMSGDSSTVPIFIIGMMR